MSPTHASYWLCDLGACLSLSGGFSPPYPPVKWIGSSLKDLSAETVCKARIQWSWMGELWVGHGGSLISKEHVPAPQDLCRGSQHLKLEAL